MKKLKIAFNYLLLLIEAVIEKPIWSKRNEAIPESNIWVVMLALFLQPIMVVTGFFFVTCLIVAIVNFTQILQFIS